MARLASLARPVESLPSFDAPLVDDRIGFDAWLLPPETPGSAERAIRFCSAAAGPVVFAAVLACVIGWIA